MTPKQIEAYWARNARYYEGGLWVGPRTKRPRYGIRVPSSGAMGRLLTADDVAELRAKFDAHMRAEELGAAEDAAWANDVWADKYGMTRRDYDELDPPEGGD